MLTKIAPLSVVITTPLLAALSLAPLVLAPGWASAQTGDCPEVAARQGMPADDAYKQAKYEVADSLYQQALLQKPDDPDLNAALVRTELREGRLADATTRANRMVADAPQAAPALTALAEVQLRQGQPWLASQTLDAATAGDRCYARAHLIRARIFRIDSMYSSERNELQAAYQIDPTDPDIHRAWTHTVNPRMTLFAYGSLLPP